MIYCSVAVPSAHPFYTLIVFTLPASVPNDNLSPLIVTPRTADRLQDVHIYVADSHFSAAPRFLHVPPHY